MLPGSPGAPPDPSGPGRRLRADADRYSPLLARAARSNTVLTGTLSRVETSGRSSAQRAPGVTESGILDGVRGGRRAQAARTHRTAVPSRVPALTGVPGRAERGRADAPSGAGPRAGARGNRASKTRPGSRARSSGKAAREWSSPSPVSGARGGCSTPGGPVPGRTAQRRGSPGGGVRADSGREEGRTSAGAGVRPSAAVRPVRAGRARAGAAFASCGSGCAARTATCFRCAVVLQDFEDDGVLTMILASDRHNDHGFRA